MTVEPIKSAAKLAISHEQPFKLIPFRRNGIPRHHEDLRQPMERIKERELMSAKSKSKYKKIQLM